ncbi:hypothetical protein AYR62_12430 [Secundilactobacillus paracollinoides]|uniref:Uncharacterized protein n=1 Tax=Secundilactobacillus paracollinoides TaxID=240427 RepID=A0A1B2IWA0_9LACO|nr:hypothetical protein [Secundilactobacillus paracollinoides]ANZ60493.1 hypothetical protein AYR61_03460 [Secundilactobacillus paracollinoides]ANZ64805.1 hypothetical protein AYR62_12430 [Secundilactobacillus paracollinoides]ANZ66320.1 hypothetical protein AYR63_03655 [Secundilactobacillus paracollinoides]
MMRKTTADLTITTNVPRHERLSVHEQVKGLTAQMSHFASLTRPIDWVMLSTEDDEDELLLEIPMQFDPDVMTASFSGNRDHVWALEAGQPGGILKLHTTTGQGSNLYEMARQMLKMVHPDAPVDWVISRDVADSDTIWLMTFHQDEDGMRRYFKDLATDPAFDLLGTAEMKVPFYVLTSGFAMD